MVHGGASPQVQVEGIADGASQGRFLIIEQQSDRVADSASAHRGDVVAADDTVVVEPVSWPDGTSPVRPRTVLVMGATVTHVSRWGFACRVRISAGRRLSSGTDAIVRISPTRGAVGR